MAEKERKTWFSYLAFPLFLALILAPIYVFRGELASLFRNREAARAWLKAQGSWGMLAFAGLEALQVVLFIIPGEVVQVVGGYAYGLWGGTALSVLGILAGSVFNFYVGRLLGRPFVEAIIRKEKLERMEKLTNSGREAAAFFLLFVIPGIPKDALCYVAGMSRFSLPLFLAVSTVGRLPGIFASSYMGSAAEKGSYQTVLAILAAASVLFFSGLFLRDQLQSWLEKTLGRGKDGRS